MSIRPPPIPKNEKKYREEILDRIEEVWQGEEWAINMPQIVTEILRQNVLVTKTPPATRTTHEADGILCIRMDTMDMYGRARQSPHKQMPCRTKTERKKTQDAEGH